MPSHRFMEQEYQRLKVEKLSEDKILELLIDTYGAESVSQWIMIRDNNLMENDVQEEGL